MALDLIKKVSDIGAGVPEGRPLRGLDQQVAKQRATAGINQAAKWEPTSESYL